MGLTHLSPPRFFFHRTDFKDSLQKILFWLFLAPSASRLCDALLGHSAFDKFIVARSACAFCGPSG